MLDGGITRYLLNYFKTHIEYTVLYHVQKSRTVIANNMPIIVLIFNDFVLLITKLGYELFLETINHNSLGVYLYVC